MDIEIGDSFIIIDTEYFKFNCKDQKEFIVKNFSKSKLSVYYEDGRTNIKCKCQQCSIKENVKCIGVSQIELAAKKKQRERNIKLKILGI